MSNDPGPEPIFMSSSDKIFLYWLQARLSYVYKESMMADFVQRLGLIADRLPMDVRTEFSGFTEQAPYRRPKDIRKPKPKPAAATTVSSSRESGGAGWTVLLDDQPISAPPEDPKERASHVLYNSLDTIAGEIHENAVEHGWWDEDPALSALLVAVGQKLRTHPGLGTTTTSVLQMIKDAWPQRNVGELLMLVVCELAEAFEEYRVGNFDEVREEDGKPEGGPVEVTDAMIRLLDIAKQRKWRIGATMRTKHQYNKTRLYRHGGKLA